MVLLGCLLCGFAGGGVGVSSFCGVPPSVWGDQVCHVCAVICLPPLSLLLTLPFS